MSNAPIHYHQLFQFATLGVYRIREDGHIVYINSFLAKLLGYENPEELISQKEFFRQKYDEDRFLKAMEEHGYFVGVSRWKRKGGEVLYLKEYAIKFKDKDGRVYYEGIVEDITPMIEEYHREKRAREEWKILFNSIPDPVMILSPEQEILDANQATLNLLNRPREEVIGQKCYTLFHGSPSPPPGCPFVEMIKRGSSMEINEVVMETVGGRFLVSVSTYKPPYQELRFLHFAKDVTLIESIGEKMIESLERYGKLLNMVNSIGRIFLKEKKIGKIVELVCRRLNREEYFGNVCVFLREGSGALKPRCKCREDAEKEIERRIIDWRGIKEMEIKGRKFLILPLPDEGRPLGFLVLELKSELEKSEIALLEMLAEDFAFSIKSAKLEKARRIAYREIERVMEDLMALADGIRNPLAVIEGLAELKVPRELRDEMLKEVEKINDATRKIDELWGRSYYLRNFLREEKQR